MKTLYICILAFALYGCQKHNNRESSTDPISDMDMTDLIALCDTYDYLMNSVSGHDEADTIIGNFTGRGIDTIYVETLENTANNPEGNFIAKSNNPDIPAIQIFGWVKVPPKLVFEGDVDGDGKDEWGYLHTWMNSQWRYYRVYNYDSKRKEWRFLYYDAGCDGQSLLDTPEYVRGSGYDIVEKGPKPGLIKINYGTWGAECELLDTIVKPTYTPITEENC